MKYQIINENTGGIEVEFYDRDEAYDVLNESYEYNHYVRRVILCRGCGGDESQEQYDAHGISTGHWCDDCYNSSKYPYRKDRYPTIETHGYGEILNDDY